MEAAILATGLGTRVPEEAPVSSRPDPRTSVETECRHSRVLRRRSLPLELPTGWDRSRLTLTGRRVAAQNSVDRAQRGREDKSCSRMDGRCAGSPLTQNLLGSGV